LAATVYGGRIWTSNTTNPGWQQKTMDASRNWISIASSADGTKLVACTNDQYIYTSTDSGNNWTTNANSSGINGWTDVACDRTGTNLVACVGTSGVAGYIYTSSNSGSSWTTNLSSSGSRIWSSVACDSSSGTKLVACERGGLIYTSTNFGSNWYPNLNATTSRPWKHVTSDASGVNLVAVDENGGVYTSRTGGQEWYSNTISPGNLLWYGVASSADGTKIAACVCNAAAGRVYRGTVTSVSSNIISGGFIVPAREGGQVSIGGHNSVIGNFGQGPYGIAIGYNAGIVDQGAYAVALGPTAGNSSQGSNSVAIGFIAGQTTQQSDAVAIGPGAGNNGQGSRAIAIGSGASSANQGGSAISIGFLTPSNQGSNAIAIGAGYAVGTGEAYIGSNQKSNAIAIGFASGKQNQGSNSIAIGAYAGNVDQISNSIILNATGAALNATTESGLYVAPIRQPTSIPTSYALLAYESSTKEIISIPSSTSRIVGSIIMFGGTTAPDGWLFCDGASYLKTSYPTLFAVIGIKFGGDSTNFSLPNMAERFARGPASTATIGSNGGADKITDVPQHSHALGASAVATVTDPEHSHGYTINTYESIGDNFGQGGSTDQKTNNLTTAPNKTGITVAMSGSTNNTGTSGGVDFVPRYVDVNYIICYKN